MAVDLIVEALSFWIIGWKNWKSKREVVTAKTEEKFEFNFIHKIQEIVDNFFAQEVSKIVKKSCKVSEKSWEKFNKKCQAKLYKKI